MHGVILQEKLQANYGDVLVNNTPNQIKMKKEKNICKGFEPVTSRRWTNTEFQRKRDIKVSYEDIQ